MSLPYYSPKYVPAFSPVLTSIQEDAPPVGIFARKDSRRTLRRQATLNLARPRAKTNSQRQDDSLMRTVDTRFVGSLAYDAEYSKTEEETHHYDREASAASTSSTSSYNSTDDEADDTVSSTSTTELDLNREFEADRNTDSDAAALSDCDIGELGDCNLPLHRQPAALSSLAQAPPSPQYDEASPSSELDTQGRYISNDVSSSSSCRPRSPRPSPPSKNLDTMKFLLGFLRMFHSLWHMLKTIGGTILRDFTKDL